MKLWHLLFLLHSSFLLTTLTVRVQDQFTFQMLQDVIPDPSSDTSSSQSQTENHILTNTDICNNLLEYLLVFGETSTSKYKTCPDKYSLLGNSNSLVQKDQPQCLLSLSQIFCTYEIVTDPVRPHPDDLRYFITQTISRCVRVIISFVKLLKNNIDRVKNGRVVLTHIFVHHWIMTPRLFRTKKISAQIFKLCINVTLQWHKLIKIS